ncbi:MAG: tyrosine-type recombinase/integrase [Bacteroidia bacterium]
MDTTEFENYLYKSGHTKETVKIYTFQVRPFLLMFPAMHAFTFRDFSRALTEFLKVYKNSNYKNTILSAIKRYYDFLLETGQRHDHPCKTMNFKTIKKKGLIHNDLFSAAELEMLMDRNERYPLLKDRNQAMISLLIYQGLQIREVVNLKVHHINLDTGKVYVKESKQGLRRHLELHPKQYRIFEDYISKSRRELLKVESDALFIALKGVPIGKDDVQYLVGTFAPLFPDRRLNCEAIRQSVISYWLNERKFPLEQVQLMAGHRWISTTVRYRQSPLDEKRLIINRLHPLG